MMEVTKVVSIAFGDGTDWDSYGTALKGLVGLLVKVNDTDIVVTSFDEDGINGTESDEDGYEVDGLSIPWGYVNRIHYY